MKCESVFALGLAAVVLGGCHHPPAGGTGLVKVVIGGGGEFPGFLVGRWQAPQQGWEIQLDPDGRISSAVISLGRVRVVPGQTTTRPTRSGDPAVFTPGVWAVHYAPDTRELTVEITMEHVRVEMAGNVIEGSSRDIFVGPITPTGHTWTTQWTTFTHYLAHTPDNRSFNLSTDPTTGETRALVFEKIDGKNP